MRRVYDAQPLTFVRVLVLAAICIAASGPAIAQNIDASVTSYIKALNASMPPNGDPDVIANVFAENGVHHGVNQGPPQVGREQIRQFFAGFKNLLKRLDAH
jgi:hypothetical protein